MLAGALLLSLATLPGPGARLAEAASPVTRTLEITSEITDTFISQSAASVAHDGPTLAITGDSSVAAKQLSGMRFGLGTIPANASVTTAELVLQVFTPPATGVSVTPMRLLPTANWSEGATWTSTNAAWNAGSLGSSVSVSPDSTELRINVTNDIGAFLGGTTNNGWVLRIIGSSETLALHSSEAATAELRPRLVVQYTATESAFRPASAYATDLPGSYEDTFLSALDAGATKGALDSLSIGRTSSDVTEGLVRFPATQEQGFAGGRVLEARLVLTVSVHGQARTFAVARVCQPASLGAAGAIASRSYANLPYAALASVQATSAAYDGEAAQVNFDVTSIVQSWANGEPNLGFGVYQSSPTKIDAVRFGSFNSESASIRPRLEVTYVAGSGVPGGTPVCGQATATATATSVSTATATNTPVTPSATPTHTATPVLAATATTVPAATGTPSPTATATATNTATATLTATATATATSTPTLGPVAPVASANLLVLTSPGPVSRSRLAFEAIDQSLNLTEASFVIRNKTGGKYWSVALGTWQTTLVENPAIQSSVSKWILEIGGAPRRSFAATTVSVEFRGKSGVASYKSAVAPEMAIR